MSRLRAMVEEVRGDDHVLQLHADFSQRVLKLKEGEAAILSNGRVSNINLLFHLIFLFHLPPSLPPNLLPQLIGPLKADESFELADFDVLAQLERSSHASDVLRKVEDLELPGLDPDDDTTMFRSELQMMVASLLRSHQQAQNRRISLPVLKTDHW